MNYDVGCKLQYSISSPSTFILNVATSRNGCQRIVTESLEITPEVSIDEYVDPMTGNRYHRFLAHGPELTIQYRATVELRPWLVDSTMIKAVTPDRLPLETMRFLLPSRYCQSDHLMRLAYREFGRETPGYAQANAISNWIHDNVDYLIGTTGSQTSAFDTATARAGVCRDFAHLGVAFCRAINIPARFVSGYAYGLSPPDFHAMFEAWLDDRWYLFDPTQQVAPDRLVRIGNGRDAGDVSFAMIFGPAQMTGMEVFALSTETGQPGEPGIGSTGDVLRNSALAVASA